MDIKWQSNLDTSSIAEYARIIDVDGDKILEVLTEYQPFHKRLWKSLKWIVTGQPLVFSRVLINSDIKKIGELDD